MSKFLKIQLFDEVTQFRLINLFLVCISMSLLSPVIIVLKGTYMIPWVIALFSISYTVALKTNKFMVPLGNDILFKLGVSIHILFIIAASTYFWNPLVTIWLESIFVFFEVMIFSAYTITLQNYITKNFPSDVPKFQITRNNIQANGTLIGLFIVTILLLVSMELAVITFIIFNILFSAWLISKWNFFQNVKQHTI